MSWMTCQSINTITRTETNICEGNDIICGFRERNDGWVGICGLGDVYAVNVLNKADSILRESVQG
jgi:hypothetical protein